MRTFRVLKHREGRVLLLRHLCHYGVSTCQKVSAAQPSCLMPCTDVTRPKRRFGLQNWVVRVALGVALPRMFHARREETELRAIICTAICWQVNPIDRVCCCDGALWTGHALQILFSPCLFI